MECSFAETAGSQLIRGALKLPPDFSEWREAPKPGDEDFLPAPEICGHYLALKKRLKHKKKQGEIAAGHHKECEIAMTILTNLAEYEFLRHIEDHPSSTRLRLRSNGWIVLVKNVTDR